MNNPKVKVDHLGELLGPHAAVRGDEAIHYGFGKGHGREFSWNDTAKWYYFGAMLL